MSWGNKPGELPWEKELENSETLDDFFAPCHANTLYYGQNGFRKVVISHAISLYKAEKLYKKVGEGFAIEDNGHTIVT